MEFSEESVNPVFEDMLEQLKKVAESIPDTQDRMMSVTGSAWSDDHLVKVEVGPRGQLVDVEIDPKVFRRPDAGQLRSALLSASSAAVAKATEQVSEIMESQFPPELAEIRQKYTPERDDGFVDLLRSDADVVAERKDRR